MSKVYLFQGSDAVIPESIQDSEASLGVEKSATDRAFGNPEYCSIFPIGFSAEPVLAYLLKRDDPLPSGWRSLPVRQIISALTGADNLPGSVDGRLTDASSSSLAEIFLRAYHLVQWHSESVYCGSCGAKNGDSPNETARLCPHCGRIEYPRISPAMITLVINDSGHAILAHNKNFKNNMYSLIAGFVEAGESLEAAVRREIKEELSINVKDIRYIRSQSWPFPNSLMVGFTARFAGGEINPDGEEITDGQWFSRETIRQCIEGNNPPEGACLAPNIPGHGSISRYIIDMWLRGEI